MWSGDTLKPVDGGPVTVAPNELYLLHWMAALTADSPPRFEILVEPKGNWTPPAPTPDYAVVSKGRSMIAIGPVKNSGGWQIWWTARSVAAALDAIPDGSLIDMAMAPRLDYDEALDPAVGRALYSGTVKNGVFHITHASPRVAHETLSDAIAFVRDLAIGGRLTVRAGVEREALDSAMEMYGEMVGPLAWSDDVARLTDSDERSLLMIAPKVFRVRFRDPWPVDPDD